MSPRAWSAFAAVSVLFGIPYLFIKIAVDGGLSPAFVAWSRVLMGAVILLALSHRAGLLRDLAGRGWWLAAYAIVDRAVMGVSLAIAALALTPLTAFSLPHEAPSGDAVLAVVVLGLLCTSVAFVVFGRLIAEVGPSRALVVTYVNPVVALALGVAVLGERPGAGAVAGLLLILAGSWLSTDGRLPPGLRSAKRERVGADARLEAQGEPMRAGGREAHEGVQALGADGHRRQRPAVELDVHRPRPATA